MAKTIFEVFLSSTSQDLGHHRTKVHWIVDRLKQACVCMETFGARPITPLEVCKEEVLKADALVVIVGHRYGWVPAKNEWGDGKRSITWLEVSWALDAGKPVFAFLVDEKAPWPGDTEQDRLKHATTEEEAADVWRAVRGLKDFRDFLGSRTTYELFASDDDFVGRVATSLAEWLAKQRASNVTVSSAGAVSAPGIRLAPSRPMWTGSPFPGLRAFTPADAPIFFGRARETNALVARLCSSTCRFLLVSGTFGSGKSSLVAAGLIPRLAANAVPGSEDWLLPSVGEVGQGHAWLGLRFTPGEMGDDPFLSLASKLAPMLRNDVRAVAYALVAAPDQLAALIERALEGRPAWSEALLFVDQFEELVTVVTDQHLQTRFVTMLEGASRSPRLRVVGTVRADFYHRCIEQQPALAELLRDPGVTVPLAVPGALALTEMVNGPAGLAGLQFDDGLVESLVDGTVRRPGGLALLAFALHELHLARTMDGRLTTSAFEKIGGLTGAINARAEATFGQLPTHVQDQLGPVFRQLVVVDDHGVATRARARRDHVVGSSSDAALVEAFERARLLVPDRAPDGTTVLEVAHEALLSEWPRLANWIRVRADDLRLLRQVDADAAEWGRHGRAAHYLWPHERLDPVEKALLRLGLTRESLSEPTRAFVLPEWERLLVNLEVSSQTHQRRAAIGKRLNQLGDRRPGVGLTSDGTPDIVWCDVPGGVVTLEDKKWTFEVAPFRISKYAITFTQYKAFVDDPEGYDNDRLWEGLVRESRAGEQYRRTGNHPAEHVSWYDAVAFCRWLSGRLGVEVRLPHESEWQQAATGGRSENTYPWGAEWKGLRANTHESQIGRTIAVGMYPLGRSVQGAMDLAGNIFEWCLNASDDQGDQGQNSKARRVQRGGSWLDSKINARTTARVSDGPAHRNNDLGFRVVCGLPSS